MTREHTQFGAVLKRYRAAAALPQRALAEQAGLSLDAISALESGRRSGPRLDTARRLADALGLGGEDRARFLAAARPGEQSVRARAAPYRVHRRTSAPPWTRSSHASTRLRLSPPTSDLIGREREVARWSCASCSSGRW